MRDDSPTRDERHTAGRQGLLHGILAYFVWGFFPLYFKGVAAVPALQVVCHRIVWSLVFLLAVIGWRNEWAALRAAFRSVRSIVLLTTTALLIATNWLVFIVAVGHDQVLQSSLGYFITPLVSVLLGVLFLKERLRRLQLVSLLLAMAGVLLLTWRFGAIPWTALILAVTFGSYGLLRKVVAVDSLAGLTVETMLLGPPALGYLLFVVAAGQGRPLGGTMAEHLLLPLAGVVTAIPLLLFAAAARQLRLTTIGFLQYLTPTLHFLLAVLIFREPFSSSHLTSFICIWAGLVIYSLDAYRTATASRIA